MLDATGGEHSAPAAILGGLSLILWTLIIVTTLKYVTIALRIDNNGEGGILALMALLRRMDERHQLFIMVLGMFGAALVYGDAAITPAISVMSALEGLNIIAPHLERYVLPATVVVLLALFAVQYQGTARIGRLLGPIMLIWFATISLLGVWGISLHPAVLSALNPVVGLQYLFSGGGLTTLLVAGMRRAGGRSPDLRRHGPRGSPNSSTPYVEHMTWVRLDPFTVRPPAAAPNPGTK